jgi:hypothetical protein
MAMKDKAVEAVMAVRAIKSEELIAYFYFKGPPIAVKACKKGIYKCRNFHLKL